MSLLLRIDAMQHQLASYVSEQIHSISNIPITIGSVQIRHLNKIEISDILLNDLEGDTLARIEKVSAHISPLHLLRNKVRINSVMLAKPYINIYKNDSLSPANIQFLLDILAGDNSTSPTQFPNIRMNQLHIYDGKFRYREKFRTHDNKQFTASNIEVDNISANISLKELSSDTLRMHIRSFSAEERSGLKINNVKMRFRASKRACEITNLNIELPNSHIKSNKITACFTQDARAGEPLIHTFQGELHSNKFSTEDFVCMHPMLSHDIPPCTFITKVSGSNQAIDVEEFKLRAHDNSIIIDAAIKSNSNRKHNKIKIDEIAIDTHGIGTLCHIIGENEKAHHILSKLGNISLTGEAEKIDRKADCHATIQTDCGSITTTLTTNNEAIECKIGAEKIALGTITGNAGLGLCDIESTLSGTFNSLTDYNGTLHATISSLTYNDYEYSPIALESTFDSKESTNIIEIADKNIHANILFGTNNTKELPEYDIRIEADSINLQPLNLHKDISDCNISFRLEADFAGENIDNGLLSANLYDFELFTPDKYWKIRRVHVTDNSLGDKRTLFINSDIFNSYIHGYYSYATLKNSFLKSVQRHIPSIAQAEQSFDNNNFVFNIDLSNSEIISQLFDLPITIYSPSNIEGNCDNSRNQAEISAKFKDIEIMGNQFQDITIDALSDDNELAYAATLISSDKDKKGNSTNNSLQTKITGSVQNNNIYHKIELKDHASGEQQGDIKFDTELKQQDNGILNFTTHIHPGNILYNGELWNIAESLIKRNNGTYNIENFELSNDTRALHVDGYIGYNATDNLKIELNEINIENILNIVNFHSVDFGGTANGEIEISKLLHEPKFSSKLRVKDFKFEKGDMGNLVFKSNWNEEEKAILIDGEIDNNNKKSIINGFISPANDTIRIGIEANGANIDFMNNMLSSVLADVKGEVNGMLYIQGKMSDINMYGKLAPTGSMRLKPTNVTYYLRGDTLLFTRNKITFKDFGINDRDNNQGIINGAVNHKSISHFTCDFNITTDNLLAYDTYSFGDDGFYGRAYVSGNALFTSNDYGIRLNAEISTENNSRFVYNASGPEGATDNKFVTFIDRNEKRKSTRQNTQRRTSDYDNDFMSKLRLDFMINTTPGLQLRVYTNTMTGDYIDIYGNGPINAVYDEKEGFNMKGNLNLTRGTYKFTLQEIFPKEFSIKAGSTLAFNGDPFLANLDLRTVYTVASAPLTDLSIAAGRRKNVKVNCLMDITGTLQSPTLTFGLELPDGNEEEKELLASATSTQEQTNMQFIYLIGIGKFYTYDYQNRETQNESSTAMESLISSTISGQLNNMISQITNNDNWNFSGNFTTSERGWNNMEVEGMLSGRMLDNRLLINGNLGYRDNPLANKNFIGDFEVQWLLNHSGNISLKAYSKTNDRYFSKTTLTTQGAGIMLRHDFDRWLFWRKKKEKQ